MARSHEDEWGCWYPPLAPPGYWVNWWPGYPNTDGLTWVPTPTGGGIGTATGGTAPPAAVPTKPPDQRPVEFQTPEDAADACLSYAIGRKPEQPLHYSCLVQRRDDRITTSDTLEAAIRKRHKERAAGVSLEALDVSLVWADVGGVVLLVEGLMAK